MNEAKFFVVSIFILVFAVCVPAQNDSIQTNTDFSNLLKVGPEKVKNLELGFSTPNEMQGYNFFSAGKLSKIKVGVSSKENISAIFGTFCKEFCDYDSKWKIQFEYFDENSSYAVEVFDEKGNKMSVKKVASLPEYFGKVRSVKFVPRKTFSFSQTTFPDSFYKFSSVSFGDDFSGNPRSVATDSYADGYGLKYIIFDKINYSTLKNKDKRQKGDLISIEYTIPRELEEKMFIEQ